MRRLELAISGFFSNGGATAFPSVAIQAEGAGGPAKRLFLEKAYDGASAVAMLCAPGLEFGWQQAILEYAGPAGRGDLFAILEAPRYLLTQPPRGLEVNDFRWTKAGGSYEVRELEVLAEPAANELRFMGFAADVVLDRCTPRDEKGHGAVYAPWLIVDNPLSVSAQDKYVVASPSGFIAGVIAGTDNKSGGGVHKAPANEPVLGVSELVTSISDREQAALNVKGINIIRHRPKEQESVFGVLELLLVMLFGTMSMFVVPSFSSSVLCVTLLTGLFSNQITMKREPILRTLSQHSFSVVTTWVCLMVILGLTLSQFNVTRKTILMLISDLVCLLLMFRFVQYSLLNLFVFVSNRLQCKSDNEIVRLFASH